MRITLPLATAKSGQPRIHGPSAHELAFSREELARRPFYARFFLKGFMPLLGLAFARAVISLYRDTGVALPLLQPAFRAGSLPLHNGATGGLYLRGLLAHVCIEPAVRIIGMPRVGTIPRVRA